MPLSTLGLSPALHAAAVRAHDLATASAIQLQAIPVLLSGQDAVVCAPTGSGKTLAYGLPALQRLLLRPAQTAQRQPGVLVLVPTRELAIQVGHSLRAVARHLQQALTVYAAYGGVSINPQLLALRAGADLLIATPGRLLDLVAHRGISLAQVECLVLDEADRMLDLGFAQELQQVLQLLPVQRQNLFISATMPPAAQALADTLLRAPAHIAAPTPMADLHGDLPDITQRAFAVDASQRTQLLRHLIGTEQWPRVLVFVATKLAAEIVADKLRRADIAAEPFHGTLSQGKRNQVLTDFKAARISVVVATDIAARGLDIAQLPVVVNFDLPRSTADYTHRIGRTGRAGAAGLAVSFVNSATLAHFRLIGKRHGVQIALETVPGFAPKENTASAPTAEAAPSQVHAAPGMATAPTPTHTASPPGTGGIKGSRPSKKDRLRAAAALAAATAAAKG